ncbi:hypothetical protein FJTKL_07504 [Diaporthe vaccinii]|uniref:Protein kinase domain-containing protein n=1 Tax=Diaporthe vaccinii TaxID=105482 RepID=A0ABR4ETL9_9PEZI
MSPFADDQALLQALRRARHIIQARFWAREIIPTEDTQDSEMRQIQDAWQPIDDDRTMLTLEFMKNGDMHHLIAKLARTNDSVPQPILWRIFFCLVRGCIAMYSPPRSITLPDGTLLPEEQWRPVHGPDMEETLPAQTSDSMPTGWNFIHYDLDPQNVLIGDMDGGEHSVAPVFKISDLGLGKCRPDRDPDLTTPLGSWKWRQMGKIIYLLPEQYHKEWDYIQKFPPLESEPPQVAGQYGPWSNIFQAALSMQNLITKVTVPYPPIAMGPLNDPAGAHLFDSAARVRDSRGNPLPSFYTHGYNLASEPGLDEDFMHLLLRCLADMPVDRPSLWELNWVMTNKERSPGWAIPENDPDGIRAWCDRLFRDPPAPPASAAEASTALAPEVLATAMQQPQAPGNDRVPGDQGDDDGDDDMDEGGDTVIPETVL